MGEHELVQPIDRCDRLEEWGGGGARVLSLSLASHAASNQPAPVQFSFQRQPKRSASDDGKRWWQRSSSSSVVLGAAARLPKTLSVCATLPPGTQRLEREHEFEDLDRRTSRRVRTVGTAAGPAHLPPAGAHRCFAALLHLHPLRKRVAKRQTLNPPPTLSP